MARFPQARPVTPDGRSRSRVWLALASALAAWLLWAQIWPPAVPRSAGVDFVQFWAVGQAARVAGTVDVYSPRGRERLAAWTGARAAESRSPMLRAAAAYRQRFETFSTPFLYQSLGWIAGGDYDRDLAAFQRVGTMAAAAAVLLLAHMMGYGWTGGLLAFLLLALASEPMASDIRVANVNRLQLLAMAGWLWAQRSPSAARQVSAGLLLGLLLAFKPTLGPALAVLALVGWATRRWRSMALQSAGVALSGAAVVVATSVAWGSARAWWDWAMALRSLERDADVSLASYNLAAAQVLSGWGVPAPSAILAAALLAVTAAVLWSARRGATGPADAGRLGMAAGSLAFAISLWPLQLVWLHYYLLFTPLALWLLRPSGPGEEGGGRSLAERILAAVAAVGALGSPHLLPAARDSFPLQAGGYILGALCLICLGWVELHRAARGAAVAPSPTAAPGG
jgi:hypothetical protein